MFLQLAIIGLFATQYQQPMPQYPPQQSAPNTYQQPAPQPQYQQRPAAPQYQQPPAANAYQQRPAAAQPQYQQPKPVPQYQQQPTRNAYQQPAANSYQQPAPQPQYQQPNPGMQPYPLPAANAYQAPMPPPYGQPMAAPVMPPPPMAPAFPPGEKVSTVYFPPTPKGESYGISVGEYNLTCQAPCVLQIPQSTKKITFSYDDRETTQKLRLRDDVVTLQMVKVGSRGRFVGGWVIESLGLAATVGGIITLAAGSPVAGHSVMGGGVLFAAVGCILVVTSVPRFKMNLGMPAMAEKDHPLDSLQFAIVPANDGFAAGAGFRF